MLVSYHLFFFQVSVMIGSYVFKILTKFTSIESFMRGVMLISSFSLAAPIFIQKVKKTVEMMNFCLL